MLSMYIFSFSMVHFCTTVIVYLEKKVVFTGWSGKSDIWIISSNFNHLLNYPLHLLIKANHISKMNMCKEMPKERGENYGLKPNKCQWCTDNVYMKVIVSWVSEHPPKQRRGEDSLTLIRIFSMYWSYGVRSPKETFKVPYRAFQYSRGISYRTSNIGCIVYSLSLIVQWRKLCFVEQ